jgi:hypothetical protein
MTPNDYLHVHITTVYIQNLTLKSVKANSYICVKQEVNLF